MNQRQLRRNISSGLVQFLLKSTRHFGMPPLLICLVIVGFGTSVSEMVVSALESVYGNAGIDTVFVLYFGKMKRINFFSESDNQKGLNVV